jgi:hypothetical protein
MTGLGACTAALLAAWSTGVVLVTASRVRRLDRLHRRLDAARHALDGALVRRVQAARRAGVDAPDPTGTWAEREATANALGRALAHLRRTSLPAVVRTELADAEQMLALARRVHNDAVRDTLGLRSRRLVRWLHLAGGAPLPRYFEIADPEPGVITAAGIGPLGTASSGRH